MPPRSATSASRATASSRRPGGDHSGAGERAAAQGAVPDRVQREVLEVYREFAEEYIHKYERDGYRSVVGVSASPRTPFNRGLPPTIGERFSREPFARVTGDVRLGDDVTVGRRTSIRADEGSPITIGDGAAIEDRVTFHALRGTSITIGSGLDTEDNVASTARSWWATT